VEGRDRRRSVRERIRQRPFIHGFDRFEEPKRKMGERWAMLLVVEERRHQGGVPF
jgi:hypothetical protein